MAYMVEIKHDIDEEWGPDNPQGKRERSATRDEFILLLTSRNKMPYSTFYCH